MGHRGELDETAARELRLYADNDADLYRQREVPIRENLKKKVAKGTYDHALAVKLWRYWADDAAKRYIEEFGTDNDMGIVFSTATRQAVAQEKADDFHNSGFEGLGGDEIVSGSCARGFVNPCTVGAAAIGFVAGRYFKNRG